MPGNVIGEAWVAIRPDMTGFETVLMASVTSSIVKAQTVADAKPINIPVTLDTGPLLAEIVGLKAAATAAGGGAGGGGMGILGGLLWGTGGLAGFAAFGSIASLAGLGFEHVLTTAIGLAGSLAGALGGLGVLAIGTFGRMAVGMASDMLVMSSTIADTKTLYAALTAIQTAQLTYGKNSTQAAAATQALNIQMALIGNTSGVQAELGLAKAAQALNSFWDRATSSARVAAVGFIEPFLSVAYTYIPLIAQAATANFTIMTAAFKPLITWANTTGTLFFKQLENLFAQEIPIGIGALTQFVMLLAKVADWAAQQTSGGFMTSIENFLKYLNTSAGFDKLTGVMTTLIGMFHDWWDLLKQIGITLVDLFSKSVGLGTTIVTTLTQMLKHLDAWLQSTSGSAAVKNLFTVHLKEIEAILAVLPTMLSGVAQIYLILAPALTSILTFIVNILGWISKIPGAGPILVWAAAIALFASKMQLLAIGSAAWAGVKDILTMFQALGAGAGFTDAIKIAFGSTSAATQMQAAVTEFSAAVTRFSAGAAAGGVEGAGAGAEGAGAGAAGGAAAGATSIATYLGPLGLLVSTAWTDWTVITGASTQAKNAMSQNVASIVKAIQGTAVGATMSQAEIQALATALANGTVQTGAQLQAFIAHWKATAGASNLTALESSAIASIIGATGPQLATNLLLWESALEKAGVSGGVAAAAQAALTAFIAKNGPITANEMGVFQAMATAAGMSASAMAAGVAAISTFVAAHGPLTTAQMLAIQNDMSHGATSAFDISLSLNSMNASLSAAVPYAQTYLKMIKLGASEAAAIATARGLSGGGGYSAQHGGVANAGSTGQLWMLHNEEAIVPKTAAGWLWGPMMQAIATGKPPAFAAAPRPAVTPIISGSSGGVTVVQTNNFSHSLSAADLDQRINIAQRKLVLALKAR